MAWFPPDRLTLLVLPLLVVGCVRVPGASAAAAAPRISLRLVGVSLPGQGRDASTWRVLAMVRGGSDAPEALAPEVRAEGAEVVRVEPERASASAREPACFFVTVRAATRRGASLTFVAGRASARCDLPLVIDLSKLDWDTWHQGEDSRIADVTGLPPADAKWAPRRLPQLWQALGVTWCRTRFVVPAAWRGAELTLHLGAIDDKDATFLNGQPIGRTDGWDEPRAYRLPQDAIRWGQENELAIAVDNVHAGGGVYRTPLVVSTGESAALRPLFEPVTPQEEQARAKPGKAGPRLPLRRMVVRNGLLHYEDGGEVCLWGVNYYPQSWQQYESLKKLGIDPRRSCDEDFDDFAAMGLDILRIHVFDTEISDGAGNLVRNDHLDVLDYLVAQCNRRGMYLMLTPIAWWGSPSARPDAFSRQVPKQAVILWPEAWTAHASYLKQFLTHENPYTGRRLVDEPCLGLFEIINEPLYWTFAEVTSGQPGRTWLGPEATARAMEGVRAAFRQFVPSDDWVTVETYEAFRCVTVRRYIDTMIAAMREAGARQPIAYHRFWAALPEVFQGIADSRCDAVTIGAYPGGLPQQKPVNDARNLLRAADNGGLDRRFARKARLVYEFDAAGTLHAVHMYPAMARHWRNLGVQVACQFQYDARALAHLNWDWPTHYLNLWHTPEKMVSFLIGGEAFRRLPRGATFDTPPDDQVFPPAAVSFSHNAALLCADGVYMQARPTDWRPLPLPKSPTRIVSVGACPYFDYEGTGVVNLRIEGDTATLRICPDVERLREDLRGTAERPLTRLHERPRPFHLRLPGWDAPTVERLQGAGWTRVPADGRSFTATPGVYRLSR